MGESDGAINTAALKAILCSQAEKFQDMLGISTVDGDKLDYKGLAYTLTHGQADEYILFLLFGLAHHTSLLLFIFPPLSCFSLSHVLSFVALFITTSIIDKKKNRTYDLRDFFFELNNSIKQQQRSVCLSQQQ